LHDSVMWRSGELSLALHCITACIHLSTGGGKHETRHGMVVTKSLFHIRLLSFCWLLLLLRPSAMAAYIRCGNLFGHGNLTLSCCFFERNLRRRTHASMERQGASGGWARQSKVNKVMTMAFQEVSLGCWVTGVQSLSSRFCWQRTLVWDGYINLICVGRFGLVTPVCIET